MNPQRRVLFTVIAFIVIVIGLLFFADWFSKTTGYILGEDQKVKFASCLNDKNTVFYSGPNCLACDKQIEILGEQALAQIKKVECSEDLCGGLKSVPAWEIYGKFYYGKKTYNDLAEMSGCEIN